MQSQVNIVHIVITNTCAGLVKIHKTMIGDYWESVQLFQTVSILKMNLLCNSLEFS